MIKKIYTHLNEWSNKKLAWPRAIMIVFMIYLGVKHLRNPMYTSLFGGINLGIHEMGHVVFRPFGEFIYVAGGTILQLLAPIVSMFLFIKQKDLFAAYSVCGMWLATNLYNVAVYVGDARALALPLVNIGGGEVIHDWFYLLDRMGILSWDTGISILIRIVATVVMWFSIFIGIFMINLIMNSNGRDNGKGD